MKPRFADVRERLRFVGMEQGDYDLERFPDFLVIGPQRTGTTWLERSLALHPEVFFAPGKELYYFNNIEFWGYHPKSLPPVEKDLGWYLDRFTISAAMAQEREAQCRSMFGCGFLPKVAGEATASYAAQVREPVIEEILTLNPDIKIITMVRNPIDRAWSHAKKDLCKDRRRKFEDVPEADWIEFFERPYQVQCGHYTTFLPRWQEMIPKQNLLVGSFAEISARPRELLIRVFGLLGIDAAERYVPEVAEERIDPTAGDGIPDALRRRLETMFGAEVEAMRAQGIL